MILAGADEMRALDRFTIERAGVPGIELMENAGARAVDVLCEHFSAEQGRRVLICCGKGNNGGDGFVVARRLAERGVRADVILVGAADDLRGDARTAYERWRAAGGSVLDSSDGAASWSRCLGEATLVVDAIFGTGLSAEVRSPHADLIEAINAAGCPVLSIDVPSGLDADRGVPLGHCVRADATVTFGLAKRGQAVLPGAALSGALYVVDIGIAPQAFEEVGPRGRLLEAADVGVLVPQRDPAAHKGHSGHVLAIAGSRGHSGAARLVAHAACRAGAGLVTLAGPESLNDIYSSGIPEAMTATLSEKDGFLELDRDSIVALLEGKSAVVAGPGMGTHRAAVQTVRLLLDRCEAPLVLDADALTCVAGRPSWLERASVPPVLTPHPGEMARLVDSSVAEVQADRIGVTLRAAERLRSVVVLKGARTVIAAPDGAYAVNPTGNPGMASGGMGDALAGFVVALLAQGLDGWAAACLGAYAHGRAGDRVARVRGPIGILASDLIEEFPSVLAEVGAARTGEGRRE